MECFKLKGKGRVTGKGLIVDISDIFQNMSTFQNVKIEILKCAWEQFPHVQKSRYGDN